MLSEYAVILFPYIIIELVLAVTALVHVCKYPNYRFGNKYIWIPVVLLIQLIGPVVYFMFGRGEE